MYYKMMNKDMTCKNGFQYEIGKTYELEGKLKMCGNGFHFCNSYLECLRYYNNHNGDKRLFEVRPLGKVKEESGKFGNKYSTDKIKIVRELDIEGILDGIMKKGIAIDRYIHYQKIPESLIEKHQNVLSERDWRIIVQYQDLSEEFMNKYADKLGWFLILTNQNLSESFLKNHINEISKNKYWHLVSRLELSEEFIDEHQDLLDWDQLAIFQHNLSEEFLEKHKDRFGNNLDCIKERLGALHHVFKINE